MQYSPGNSNFHLISTKSASSKWLKSKLRWNRVQSIDNTLEGSYMPLRFLPTQFIDVSTEAGIVVPMCKIVSIKSIETSTSTGSGYKQSSELGFTGDADEAKLAISKTVDDTAVYVDANDPTFGYPEELSGLFTIANGGTAVTDTYTAYDETLETIGPDGQEVSQGDNCPTRTANVPSGIVIYDIWKDIRGRYLNLAQPTQLGASILRKGKIWVPYVKESYVTGYNAAYKKVSAFETFLTWTDDSFDGMSVIPDLYGNFAEYDSSATPSVGEASDQIVGKVINRDTRVIKSLIDQVDTYPNSMTRGMDTAGVDQYLYTFVKEILKANGSTYKRTDIADAIKSGDFGLAYVQIDV